MYAVLARASVPLLPTPSTDSTAPNTPYRLSVHQSAMDPLSLTASVLTVIGAAAATAKTVSKLKYLATSFREIGSLESGIFDLHNFFCQAKEAISNQPTAIFPVQRLCNTSDSALSELAELRTLLEYVDGAANPTLARLRWLRHRERIKSLEDNLSRQRTSFSALLTVVTG